MLHTGSSTRYLGGVVSVVLRLAGTAAALLLAAALPAQANVIVTVNCTAGGLSGSRDFQIECNGGAVNWELPNNNNADIGIMAGDVRLATLQGLSIQSDYEPYINLRFSVEASGTDTTFDINSAVVSFDPLLNPQAYASAGVTLTSDSDGATITGLFPGGKNYQARYNGTSVYANLVDGFAISGNKTLTNSDRQPASGYGPISGTLSSIQSEFNFTLSALDQASGTSRFEVVPEPATLTLVAFGLMAGLARRFRRC